MTEPAGTQDGPTVFDELELELRDRLTVLELELDEIRSLVLATFVGLLATVVLTYALHRLGARE